jgi:hypothetical protein
VCLSALSFANSHFSDNVQRLIVLTYRAETPDYVPPLPSDSNIGETAPPRVPPPNIPGSSPPVAGTVSVSSTPGHDDALRAMILELQENTFMLVKLTQFERQIDDLLRSSAFKDLRDEPDLTIQLRMWRAIGKVVTSYNDIIFGLVNTYVLPLLCALLGAAAYRLRSLSEATLARTYRVSHTSYGRAILAVIVGFTVGFFSKFASTLSLEPLAAAFIAGYAVESFFIFLDTLLQAVRKPKV